MRSVGRTAPQGAAWAIAGLCLAGCGGPPVSGGPPAEPPPAEPRLIPIEVAYGETAERTLAGGECHLLELDLEADRYVEATVRQRGIDVCARLHPPEDGEGLFFDSPTSDAGTETVAFVTERGGRHRIEICPCKADAEAAPYDLGVAAPVSPTEAQRATARGFRRYSEAEEAAEAGDPKAAIATFEMALRDFEEAGVVPPQAWTRYRLGSVEYGLQRFGRAEGHYAAAALVYRDLGHDRQRVSALSYVGRSRSSQGDYEGAREAYVEALEAAERSGEPALLLQAHENVAMIDESLGQTLHALEHHRARRQLAAELKDPATEWDALWRMGKVYRTAGDDRQAQRIFEEALAFGRRHELAGEVALLMADLARIHLDREEPERAAAYLEQALAAHEATGPDRDLAEMLNSLGRCQWRLGDRPAARRSIERALAAIPPENPKARELEALFLINMAWLELLDGEPEAAYEPCDRALTLLQAAGDARNATGALKCLAEVAVTRGQLPQAAAHMEHVLEIVETLRNRSALQDLRAYLVEDSYAYYEFLVEILARLHEREPERGHAAAAFAVAERARARLLLDRLTEAEREIRAAADPGLVARRLEIERRMSNLETDLFKERAGRGSEVAIRRVQDRLRGLEAEHAVTTARLFADYPAWPSLLTSEPAGVEEIRHELLGDDDTQLVSFLLGEDRSFAWILGRDSLRMEVLPPRERIERLSRAAVRHFERGDQPHLALQGRLVAAELAAELFAPLMPHLTAHKLVLVKDGVLHHLPFAALPVPGAAGEGDLLIDRYELVEVPSASAAVALRHRRTLRNRAAELDLAIFADPVFQSSDERLAGSPTYRRAATSAPAPEAVLSRQTRSLGHGALKRLTGSRVEADRISQLVPEGRRLVALGFEASRNLLLGDELGRYRILHLAGHGLVHPELTGLILSLYDREGRQVDGLIRPYELYGLDLAAELVVLSACSTGLGDEVRGEGLLGLSRGFLYAGASKVLASLWDVDDQATAALMERFYLALLQDGDPPSRALRRAQLSLRSEPRWSAPHYWAGFVLQGDGV